MPTCRVAALVLAALAAAARLAAEETPQPQPWDYAAAMKAASARSKGRAGVVLHLGDSITYANPYGAWARYGAGRTPDDVALLRWMHAGDDNDTDGWWLARVDLPGGRSHTACSGIRSDEMLAGGKSNLPPLAELLDKYQPQMAVLMLGTNDVSAGRKPEEFRADMTKAVDLILERGIIPIVSTIPPHVGRPELARSFNEALRALAKAKSVPLVDFEAEILKRRPNDWDGTLLGKGDVHPTANQGGANPASEPTAENLRNSGYLLRGWLSVKKIGEVKRVVLDGQPQPQAGKPDPAKAEAAPAKEPPAAPEETVKLPVTRDTYFSNVGPETDGNMGGATRLKVKSIQEMTLLDVDPAPLAGQVIRSATLHVHGKDLRRVTVGSFAADWHEGTSTGYKPQNGSSSFRWAAYPDKPWTKAGGDLCAVMLGQGGTIWRMADATPVDAAGWQHVPIDPAVLAARVAGLSKGLLVFDDTGSEWTRDGEKFSFDMFPNRFFDSRESGPETAPYVTAVLGEEDHEPPGGPDGFKLDFAGLPTGEFRVSWVTPADVGRAGTLGFVVTDDGNKVRQDLVPPAGKPGERVTIHLRPSLSTADAQDLERRRKTTCSLTVAAVDAAGNIGSASSFSTGVAIIPAQKLPGVSIPFTVPAGAQRNELPKLGECQVAILDALDKVQPVTGEMIPPQSEGYLVVNSLWNARRKEIRVCAAKNEFVGFQILISGQTSGLRPRLEFAGEEVTNTPQVTFGRYAHVASPKGPLPDPIVPLDGPLAVPTPDDQIAGQQSGSILCEIYIPHDVPAGKQTAKLRLESASGVLELPVQLTVWDFTLPDHLSFLPEMNCYGLPDNERAYYRLAQLHRTVLNRVPYHQSGSVEPGCAPQWDGRTLDWTEWDKRFGPLLDGSAFADLPRGAVPVECFYLPIHENWPTPMAGNYNGSYWADAAFGASYRQALVEVSRQMAQHFSERGWQKTLFQFFLNGKNNFKTEGWSRGSSPWLLDEPANFQDYWALRWFGSAFHEGVKLAGEGNASDGQTARQAKLLFRADISRPQWQRDALDAVLDYNVVGGGAFRQYHDLVLTRKRACSQIVVDYGSSNAIEQSNMQPVGWALDSWSLESDGIVPWQTIGNAGSWTKADAECLFYPPRTPGGEPIPSIRLKAYRRGQQDVEYLTLWEHHAGQPRWALGQRLREVLHLAGQREGTDFADGEDAGVITFAGLLPQQAAALRDRLGPVLSKAHPRAQTRLVEFRTPARDGRQTSPGYVSGTAPAIATAVAPTSPAPAAPSAGTIVLQGAQQVRDALIDFATPAANQGAESRGNALRRAERGNAFLVRFGLDQVQPPSGARLKRATLSFYVWDPSSRGNTKVVAARLKRAWDDKSATWQRPGKDQTWQTGDFDPAADTADATPGTVVKPEQGSDTAEPPLEYQLDVTLLAKAWLDGSAPNFGLAILPVVDRPTDDGLFSRFQIYASEYNHPAVTPKLVLEFER